VALRAAFLENRSESSADKLAELMREVDQVRAARILKNLYISSSYATFVRSY
jgi:hypothetical protein